MLLVRERPSLRHTHEIETPGGRFYRWAADEPSAANVPGNARRASTMPGGWSDSDLILARNPSVDYHDLERLTTIRSRSAAGEIVGEYRLEGRPSSSGDQMNVGAVMRGWQAHLDDNKSASGVLLDRDLGRLREMSRARRFALAAVGLALGNFQVSSDSENVLPALVLSMNGPWDGNGFRSQAWYDAGAGNGVGDVYYEYANNANVGAGGSWLSSLQSFDADDASGTGGTTGNLAGSTTGSGVFDAEGRRYIQVELGYGSPEASALTYERTFRLAFLGDHGITPQGSDLDDLALLASDIAEYVVRTWAPLLTFTTGPDGTLQPSVFGVPHAAFYDPTTAGEMLRQAIRFELLDWAVWDYRTFHLNARNARGRNWRVSVADAQLEETGPQVDRLWESIIVQYRDVDGTTRTVGPPGSRADTETSVLKDADPENPANQLGIIRRDLLTMGVGTADSATKIGREFLEQSKLLDSSGRARLVGHVVDDHGVLHPYSHVRAGDTLTPVDAHDFQPRRIVKADQDDTARATSVDLDAPPEGLQALLERLDVQLVPLGLG